MQTFVTSCLWNVECSKLVLCSIVISQEHEWRPQLSFTIKLSTTKFRESIYNMKEKNVKALVGGVFNKIKSLQEASAVIVSRSFVRAPHNCSLIGWLLGRSQLEICTFWVFWVKFLTKMLHETNLRKFRIWEPIIKSKSEFSYYFCFFFVYNFGFLNQVP